MLDIALPLAPTEVWQALQDPHLEAIVSLHFLLPFREILKVGIFACET